MCSQICGGNDAARGSVDKGVFVGVKGNRFGGSSLEAFEDELGPKASNDNPQVVVGLY